MRKKIIIIGLLLVGVITMVGCQKKQVENNETANTQDIILETKDHTEEETESEVEQLIESRPLKDIYKNYFYVGVALNPTTIGKRYQNVTLSNFDSVTCENEMKPDYILDYNKSIAEVMRDSDYVAVNFDKCKDTVEFCESNELKMRLHTLVWHAQTPEWFFHEDYDVNKDLVDAKTMEKRMQNYISAVITYFDTEHPTLIYSIDVVNEAFNGEGKYKIKDKENRWYDTIGYDYLYYAFLYAKQAIESSTNMKDVTLVYNDYAMLYKYDTVTKGLEGIFQEHDADVHQFVDVIGLQAHLDTDTSMKSFAKVVRQFGDEGYEIQLTELDMGIPKVLVGEVASDKELKKQGEKYKYIMESMMGLVDEGYHITSISVWGISDDNSWRRNDKGFNAYALLFNEDLSEKPAFRGMAMASEMLSYYTYGLDF